MLHGLMYLMFLFFPFFIPNHSSHVFHKLMRIHLGTSRSIDPPTTKSRLTLNTLVIMFVIALSLQHVKKLRIGHERGRFLVEFAILGIPRSKHALTCANDILLAAYGHAEDGLPTNCQLLMGVQK